MEFPNLLELRPGVTAVIGSGGKTSLLRRLAAELPGTVLLCTTTHIRPFANVPLLTDAAETAVRQALQTHHRLCLGTFDTDGKLTAPTLPIESLSRLADYVLVEADGAKGRPLKAHAPYEPVIPPESRQVICVVGASGFGQPIETAVHRPEYFQALTGAGGSDLAEPELVAHALLAENLCDTVFLNQTDSVSEPCTVKRFAAALAGSGLHATVGSLQNGCGYAV